MTVLLSGVTWDSGGVILAKEYDLFHGSAQYHQVLQVQHENLQSFRSQPRAKAEVSCAAGLP